MSDRHAEKLASTAADFERRGYSVVNVPADVTFSGQVDEVVQQGLQTFARIDILVNNAAPAAAVMSALQISRT